jgi:hypothetical protein
MSVKLARCYLYKGVTYNPAYTVDGQDTPRIAPINRVWHRPACHQEYHTINNIWHLREEF